MEAPSSYSLLTPRLRSVSVRVLFGASALLRKCCVHSTAKPSAAFARSQNALERLQRSVAREAFRTAFARHGRRL